MRDASLARRREPDAPPNLYKQADKRWKAFRRAADIDASALADIVDPRRPDSRLCDVAVAADAPAWLRGARIQALRGIDGFRLIPCPFSTQQQLQLARAALAEWVEPPAVTNLPLQHGPGPHRDLWVRHKAEPRGSLLSRLSWATVGYHYQWTQRAYDAAQRCPMPAALRGLSSELAAACGWALRPEAAILNYYGAGSSMGGHHDDAEPCQSVPIVSISLGLEAIYLLGGPTKETAPVPIWLRSGDVVLQGGESRGYVHGVPRVLAGGAPPELPAADGGGHAAAMERAGPAGLGGGGGGEAEVAELARVRQWLAEHRLNINVRQCFEQEGGDSGGGGAHESREGHGEPDESESAKRRRVDLEAA